MESGELRMHQHVRKQVPRPQRDDLVSRAQRGDRRALVSIVELIEPKLRRAARSFFGWDHPDIDDVVQESLIAFIRALPSFEQRCSVLHYAYRITIRTCLAGKRSAARRGERVELVSTIDKLPEAQTSGAVTLAERVEITEMLLEALPLEQAEAMSLVACLGMSAEEAAAATSVPTGTVRSRLRLARLSLRRRITRDPALRELYARFL